MRGLLNQGHVWDLARITSLKQLGIGKNLAVLLATEQPERCRQETQRADEEVEA